MTKKRRRYDDKFRASAVVMLEAAGYPDRDGSLAQVAKACSVPHNTLRGWYHAERNPPPSKLRQEKRLELLQLLENEIAGIFSTMPGARLDASYRDLGTVAGIFIDKRQLLLGEPTSRNEIVGLLKDGTIKPEDLLNELSDTPDLAKELFESAGLQLAGTREAKAEIQTE